MRRKGINLILTALIVASAYNCGKDDDGQSVDTGSIPEFSISRKDDRRNSILRLIKNEKIFPKTASTQSIGNVATIEFTQKEYDNFVSTLSGKGGANNAVFDRLELVVPQGDEFVTVYSETNPTISNDVVAPVRDVSNSLELYSQNLQMRGNASVAEFFVIDRASRDTIARDSAKAGIFEGGSAGIDIDFFSDGNVSIVDLLGKKTGFQDVFYENIAVEGQLLYEGGPGPSGGYTFVPGDGTGGNNRSQINFNVEVNNIPQEDFMITLTNINVPDSTYTLNTNDAQRPDQLSFDVYAPQENTQYTLELRSNDSDPFYEDFDSVITLSPGQQPNQTLTPEGYNEISLDLILRNINALAQARGNANVKLFSVGPDNQQGTADDVELTAGENYITDANGAVTIPAPLGEEVYVEHSGSGLFRLQEKSFQTATNPRRSESRMNLGYLAIPNNLPGVQAQEILKYFGRINAEAAISFYHPAFDGVETTTNQPMLINVPAINGNTEARDRAREHIQNLANRFNYNIAFVDENTPEITQSILNSYQPALDKGRNNSYGQWAPKITGFAGTGTLARGTEVDGTQYVTHAQPFNLGTDDELLTWHEALLLLNPINNVLPGPSIYSISKQDMRLDDTDDKTYTDLSNTYQKAIVDTRDGRGVRMQMDRPFSINDN